MPVTLLLVAAALAGDWLALPEKLAQADAVVEVSLSVAGEVPASWPNRGYEPRGWGFPDALSRAALAGLKVTRVIKGEPEVLTSLPVSQPWLFGSSSACWWAAHERGQVRSLVFLQRRGDGWVQVYGVEHGWGAYSDLNARYPQLVEALAQAAAWSEVDPAVATSALASDDPYLLELARAWVLAHGGEAAIDAAWGAPGSPERVTRERAATWSDDHGRCEALVR